MRALILKNAMPNFPSSLLNATNLGEISVGPQVILLLLVNRCLIFSSSKLLVLSLPWLFDPTCLSSNLMDEGLC